ncbi:hypothetical protein KJI95_05430 [Shewanella sp. JM162201]|uniref:Uncharacterized protein n=1 Tax=Shewanella jiangmenensis TaxID=2837387 RepID=A0ABS5V2E0_9GAMM|nr:hypothetical protein [Shewanella jiangmenensis]MBT1443966.1 hypothetical protein [Shewanella jiangmenensis]
MNLKLQRQLTLLGSQVLIKNLLPPGILQLSGKALLRKKVVPNRPRLNHLTRGTAEAASRQTAPGAPKIPAHNLHYRKSSRRSFLMGYSAQALGIGILAEKSRQC